MTELIKPNEDVKKSGRALKSAIRVGVLIVFLGIFVWYFLTHRADFKVLREIPFYTLIAIAFLQLCAIIFCNAAFMITQLRVYDLSLPRLDGFVVIVKSAVINFFGFLQGGAGYRAYYLKKRFNIKYSKFALLFTANYLIVFLINALFGLIGALVQLNRAKATSSYGVILFFAGLMFVLLILMLIKPSHIPGKSKFLNKVRSVLGEWNHMLANKKLVAKLFLIALVQYWIMALLFYIELRAIHVHPSFSGIMVYAAVTSFSILIAITPAGIGFRESLLIFSKKSLGVSTSAIIVSSTLDRIVYFVLLIVLSIAVQSYIAQLFRKVVPKKV